MESKKRGLRVETEEVVEIRAQQTWLMLLRLFEMVILV